MTNCLSGYGLFVHAVAGSYIANALEEAKKLSIQMQQPVVFVFNGVLMRVDKNSDVGAMHVEYRRYEDDALREVGP